MNQSETLIIFGLYLSLMLIIGELCARYKIKTLDDYLVAGRRHGIFITGGTIAATVIGAGSTIGTVGAAYYVGISAAWYLISACIGLIFLAFTFAPALRKMSLYTVPEFVDIRFGIKARMVATILGFFGSTLFLAAQFYAMGALITQLVGLPLKLAIIVSGLVVILYTWRGGSWAVNVSDNVQIIWISIGLAITCIIGINIAGGISELTIPPIAKGFEEVGKNWFNPLNNRPVSGWNLFALGNTIIGWIIMSTTWHFAMQSTAQRILSSKTDRTAKYGCLLASGILIPLALFIVLTGMAARILYPDLLPSSDISQGEALPALIKGIMNPIFAGIILGALVAVIMSTCDSILLGASTMFIKDIYQRLLRPKITDHALIGISKWVTLIIGIVAIVSALITPSLIRMLEMTATVYCVALFVPIILGLYWKKANQSGAIAGMITGSLGGILWRALGWEKASGIHMLNISLPFALIVMVVVSLAAKRH